MPALDRPKQWLTLGGRLPWTFLPLLLIIVVALGLRLNGIDWDSGRGFHPDERDIYMRSGCMYDLLTEAPGHAQCGYLIDQPDAEPGLPGLGTLLDADKSPLNPHWFPLGSILIYVLVFFRWVIELFTDFDALDMRFVGRTLSALADTGSVFMVFVIGRRMYGRGVGLLAAAFTALAVIHIQNSHFYRPETFSVLLILASFWAMLRMVERKRLRDSALLGLMVGLALAPKLNVLPLVIPLGLAYGYRVLDSVDGRWSNISPEVVLRVAKHAALAVIVSGAVFFICSPYALLDFGNFYDDLKAQTTMARNAGLLPFTVQYIDTAPFIYQFQQSAIWGMGLPLGLAAWGGVLFTAVFAFLRRITLRADLLLLAWVVPTFLFLESFEVRFQRYIFPLIPFLILMGSRTLLWLVEWARDGGWRSWHPQLGTRLRANPAFDRLVMWSPVVLLALVLASTAFYALAFQRVYAKEHPALAASRWIKTNVPAGTAIVSDTLWDEKIPDVVYVDRDWPFEIYEADTPAKMDTLAARLSGSEYLLFYSNRPYSSVSRDPERFPYSINYYRQLFGEKLGYRLERSFTSYPGLAGVEFRDEPLGRAGLPQPHPLVPQKSAAVSLNLGYADDNVVGYDHPRVLLFRNVDHFSFEITRLLLDSPSAGGPDTPKVGLLLSEEDRAVQQGGGTWSEIIDRDSWTNSLPIIAWLLVVELAYLVSLPISMFIFRPLPDRGIILARILGLLGISYVAWLTVSLGWMDFSRASVILGFLVVAALSAAVLLARWREVFSFLREHWKLLVIGEVLFLVAFLAFVGVRAANPDLWHPWRGGEKPMELAYFTAVIRSTTLPPFDPWFAGGYLNYYYYGYFILGSLVRVTGILPTVAFNLGVPLFFALTVTGAYTLVYNLTEGVRRARGVRVGGVGPAGISGVSTEEGDPASPEIPDLDTRLDIAPGYQPVQALSDPQAGGGQSGTQPSRDVGRLRRAVWTPVGAGLLASLFIAVIGNLDGIIQIVQNTWRKLADGGAFPTFDFWRSSRMLDFQENFDPSPIVFWVPDKVAGLPDMSSHITEFPFFTFLFADLHAHMMAIPFTLLVIGLGLNLVAGLRNQGTGWTIVSAGALALSLGALWVINSWDYPSYLLLTLAMLALAVYFKPGSASQRLGLLAVLAVGVVVVSLLAYLPFHQSYETFNSGLDASKWRTPIERFLGIHGLFFFIIATFLVYNTRGIMFSIARGVLPSNRLTRRVFGWGFLSLAITSGAEPSPTSLSWLRWAWAAGLVAALLLAVTGYWTVLLLLIFLMLNGTLFWGLLTSNNAGQPFASVPLLLLGMALTVAIGVDFIRIEGDIGRMNTFFKYYLEVWVLLSLVSAYMVWHLGTHGLFGWRWNWAKVAWLGVLALLVGSSLIYTGLGSKARVDNRFNSLPATLDGTAYMQGAVYFELDQPLELKGDRDAIRWLQDNVRGSPVVLEAHTEQYRWGARIANYTGLPTVLGWPWHQTQQRVAYDFEVRNRANDIRELYNTTDLARTQELLRRYEIRYIVVGALERIYYDSDGLGKFPRMTELGLLQQAYQNEGVSIYRVN